MMEGSMTSSVKVAVTGGGNFQFSSSSFRCNGLGGEFFLSGRKPCLHLLDLFHHFHYVHGRCVWVDELTIGK